ncbi:peptidylprolyl isomerase [Paraburkholderia caledonica]|uniref:Parvulin-like peptidyl-prolyl isomerase n=1 Tax=Paraburkholderia caledonica TaxID=134536 RepID=A0AB73IU72_9BURK|nr:parvulin-like peptidyl-prolyl isomerase [Paraburkholderia caledonica]
MPFIRRFLRLMTLVAASAAVAAPPSNSPPAAEVALRVGDRALSARQYKELATALTESTNSRSFATDESLLKSYAETALLADSARRHDVDQDGVVAARIRVAVDAVLAQAERDRLYRAAAVTDDDVRERLKARPGEFDEYELSHIFVACTDQSTTSGNQSQRTLSQSQRRSQNAALARTQQIRAKLDAGADFDTLARKYSEDKSSSEEGGHLPGSLGMFLAPEFISAIGLLRVGEVSQPIRSSEGYHLIRVDAHIVATFTNRRKMIDAVLRDEAVASSVAAITRSATVQFNEEALK